MAKVDLIGAALELPAGWRGVSFTAIAPPAEATPGRIPPLVRSSGVRDTVTVAADPVAKGTTPKAYMDAQLEGFRGSENQIRVATSEEFQRGNHPALRAELTSVGPDGEYLRQLQHIVVRGGEVWVMVGTSADGPDWSEAKARFEKLFASLAL